MKENETPNKLFSFVEAVLRFLFIWLRLLGYIIFKIRRVGPTRKIPPATNQLLLQPATELARLIRKRKVKSSEIVEAFIKRLKETNPMLNFMVDQRFKEALDDAKTVDDFMATTAKSEDELELSQPLLGVPFTVKASLAVKGLDHSVGVLNRKGVVATEDAKIVCVLREAGAIPLAVTNTPEICCWWETFNKIHGTTNNPYNTNYTPGGSSGGEAAAISAAASVFGVGSDFAGSIRVPAQFCGLFGHKATADTTHLDGHYPLPDNQVVVKMLVTGPLARYATDLRLLTKILTKDSSPELNLDKPIDFNKLKVFYMDDIEDPIFMSGTNSEIKAQITKTVRYLKSKGASVEKINIHNMKYAMLLWLGKAKTDDGPQVPKYLSNEKNAVNLVNEALKTCVGASKVTYSSLLFGLAEIGNGVKYKGPIHSQITSMLDEMSRQMKSLLKDNGVLLFPTSPNPAPRHHEAITKPLDLGYTAIVNALELPATHCPTGLSKNGLPIGLQVVANYAMDHLTIGVAEELEKAFGGWVPPY